MAEKSVLENNRTVNGTATDNGTPSQPRHFSFFSLTATATTTQNNNSKNHLKSGPRWSEGLEAPPAVNFSEEVNMKPTLLALVLLLAFASPPLRAQAVQPITTATATPPATNAASTGQATNPAASALTRKQTNQALSAEIEPLLKYQEFLRKESDQSATQLNGLIQHTKDWMTFVGWIATALAAFVTAALGFFGFTSLSAAKKYIQERADKRLQEAAEDIRDKTQDAFDARLKLIDKAYSRRQAKYLKLQRSYFSKLFEANPTLVKQWLGSSLDGQSLRGKRALWVEDDGVGIALLVELLKTHCGLEIEIVESTEKALAEALTSYQLVISNLRRDPHDDAGIRLTEAIRTDRRSKIPIIIFTRPENAALYKDAINEAGANAIALSDADLLSEIAKHLLPKAETTKE